MKLSQKFDTTFLRHSVLPIYIYSTHIYQFLIDLSAYFKNCVNFCKST